MEKVTSFEIGHIYKTSWNDTKFYVYEYIKEKAEYGVLLLKTADDCNSGRRGHVINQWLSGGFYLIK